MFSSPAGTRTNFRPRPGKSRSASTGRVEYAVADMSQRGQADQLAQAAIEALGRIDILVNNAGSNLPQPIDQIRDEDWDNLVELNLSSCMALTRALVPFMKERRWGRIIHISSIMGFSSAGGRNAYSATKSALLGLARASANDLGPFGITVNCIAPGPILTDLPHEPAFPGKARRVRPRNRPGPLGPARGTGRPRPPSCQRRRQLHHRRLHHR